MSALADGRHFAVAEMACHDGTAYPEEWPDRLAKLFRVMDAIRDAWGRPIHIVSGYRSPAHNAALVAADEAQGSHQVASGSMHVEGLAADLCPVEGPHEIQAFHDCIMDAYRTGVLDELGGQALYPISGWVHVDVREQVPAGHLATWPAR